MSIKLGSKVKDIYTGFSGILTSHTEWLYGCARVNVESTELDKEGKIIPSEVFDEQRISVIEEGTLLVKKTPIPLGSKVKDIHTGFTGTLVAYTEWLYGCPRLTIEPQDLDKDGKVQNSYWFDAARVTLVEKEVPRVSKQSKSTTGGPYDAPQRSKDPI
jgi:hypothetical protein